MSETQKPYGNQEDFQFHVPERYRLKTGKLASDESFGNNGAFMVPGPCGRTLGIIASDGKGWEHVSVSLSNRKHMPNWIEMSFIKSLFWGKEAAVVQFHPPRSEYVNYHEGCLRLWRPIGIEIPRPPSWMVGSKGGLS
jgi:hypothetical protein